MKYLFLLLTSINAFAAPKMMNGVFGDWASGGGNSIVCFAKNQVAIGEKTVNIIEEIKKNKNIIKDEFIPHIKSIEVYDLHEAKKRRGINSSQPEILEIRSDEKIYDYITRMGQRFSKTNLFVPGILDYAKGIIPDSKLVFNNYGLTFQNDIGNVALPSENCVLTTMAAQVNFNDSFEVHIDDRLFNHKTHSYQSQATLIAHELIYSVARKEFKHKYSNATRNLVRMLISYHSSINEQSVSEDLVKSGFYISKNYNLRGILTRTLNFSNTVNRIFSIYESFSQSFASSMSILYNADVVTRAISQFKIEGVSFDQYSKDFNGFVKMWTYNRALRNSNVFVWGPIDLELQNTIKNFLDQDCSVQLMILKNNIINSFIMPSDNFKLKVEEKVFSVFKTKKFCSSSLDSLYSTYFKQHNYDDLVEHRAIYDLFFSYTVNEGHFIEPLNLRHNIIPKQ